MKQILCQHQKTLRIKGFGKLEKRNLIFFFFDRELDIFWHIKQNINLLLCEKAMLFA
jgi:hypothetical protein